MTLAHANGLDGRLSLSVACRQGCYVLALCFDDDAKFDDATVEMRWGAGPVERRWLYPDHDDEVLYLTIWRPWPSTASSGATEPGTSG